MSSKDVQRVLKEKNVNAGLTTVRKAIDAAGFVSSRLHYCLFIRDVNKANLKVFRLMDKRPLFCALVLNKFMCLYVSSIINKNILTLKGY